MMEFCPKCGSIMVPVKKGKQVYLKCPKCGYTRSKAPKSLKLEEKVKHEKVLVIEKDETNLPVTEKICPKCGHNKAWWWVQQTRSADEPPTQFFKCTKCGYVWREY